MAGNEQSFWRSDEWLGIMLGAAMGASVFAILGALVVDPVSHRQGVIDHATGEWQAEHHEPTDSWKVWEVDDG